MLLPPINYILIFIKTTISTHYTFSFIFYFIFHFKNNNNLAITNIICYNLYFILSNHCHLFIIFFIMFSSLKYLSFYSNNFTFYSIFLVFFTSHFLLFLSKQILLELGSMGGRKDTALITCNKIWLEYHRTCMVSFMGSQTYPTRKLLQFITTSL